MLSHLLYLGFVAGCIHWLHQSLAKSGDRRRLSVDGEWSPWRVSGWKRWVTLALGKGNSMISRLDFNFRQVLTGMHKGLFFCQNDLDTSNMLHHAHHVAGYEYIWIHRFHMVSICALPRPIPWISTAGEGRRCGQNSGPSTACRGWKLRHRGVTYCKAILRRAQWMTFFCFKGAFETRTFTSKEHINIYAILFQTKAILGMTGKIKQSA